MNSIAALMFYGAIIAILSMKIYQDLKGDIICFYKNRRGKLKTRYLKYVRRRFSIIEYQNIEHDSFLFQKLREKHCWSSKAYVIYDGDRFLSIHTSKPYAMHTLLRRIRGDYQKRVPGHKYNPIKVDVKW